MLKACQRCATPTGNPKFCSMRCSAIAHNKERIRIKKRPPCEVCHKPVHSLKVKKCKECIKPSNIDMTLAEAAYHKYGPWNMFTLVRTRARAVAKKLGMSSCIVCGYDKHIEVAHLKPVSSFDPSTLLSVINSPDNIRPLCRNHHWEVDHGLLDITKFN